MIEKTQKEIYSGNLNPNRFDFWAQFFSHKSQTN